MTIKPQLKITIITATRNSVTTIAECLASVAAQSWESREHIVIDGLSNDGTLELLETRLSDLAVLVSEEDQGIYDALNKGLKLATGDVVGFLHSDDVYAHPGVLSLIGAAFSDPMVCAIYGDLKYVKKSDLTHVVRYWKSTPWTHDAHLRGWMPPHPTLYVRREWYERIGGFDKSYRIAADYLSILKLFNDPNFKSRYIPEVLVLMRLGGASNNSFSSVLRKSNEDWRALRDIGVSKFVSFRALIYKNISKLSQFR